MSRQPAGAVAFSAATNDYLIAEYLETGDESVLRDLDDTTAADARAMRALIDDASMWESPSDDVFTPATALVFESFASQVAGGSILPTTGRICCSIAQVASFWFGELGLSSTITS